MLKSFILFTFILYDKIVGTVIFEQRCCDIVLSIKMLFEKQGSQGFIYAFIFGIKGTIVKLYLFNNRISFDVVVVIKKV